MTRLSQGCYHDLDRGPFDLRGGQIRTNDFVHNGGWYNKEGAKLGWGDLSLRDMENIRDQLTEGEMFIILGEQDSYWKFYFPTNGEKVDAPVNNPGQEYVAKKARFAIAPGQIYALRYSPRHDNEEELNLEVWSRYTHSSDEPVIAVPARWLKHEELLSMMKGDS